MPFLIFPILIIVTISFIFLWIQVLKLTLLMYLLFLYQFIFLRLSFIIEDFDIFLWTHLFFRLNFSILFQDPQFQYIFMQAHFLGHSMDYFQLLVYKAKIFSQQIHNYFLLPIIMQSFFSFHALTKPFLLWIFF